MKSNAICLLSVLLGFISANSIAEAAPPPRAPAKWTMLIFLNANNNLNSWAFDNLVEMEKIGSTRDINVVVQWADIERKTSQRFLVQRSTDSEHVTSPILQDLGAVDMGDWHRLVDFIQWGVQNFPAEHYFIDVWDHGTGWHDLRQLSQDPPMRAHDISHDEITGHWINTQELGLAMAEARRIIGHKVDFYASDACEMAMVEIATEVADSVEIYGGSEMDIPTRGWPYDAFLRKWVAQPNMSARDVGKLLVEEYIASYMPGGEHKKGVATFSIFDLSQTDALLSALQDFGQNLYRVGASPGSKAQAIDAAISSVSITADYNDLLDFADLLEQKRLPEIDAGVFDRLRSAAASYVVTYKDTPPWQRMLGISIWLPPYQKIYKKYYAQYQTLKFSRRTSWEKWIAPLVRPK